MAENDRFEKSFKPGSVKPYRLLLLPDVADTEVIDALITPFARTLREEGIPGLKEMSHSINEALWRLKLSTDPNLQANALIEVFDRLDDTVRSLEGHRHTKIAAETAKSMIIEDDGGVPAGTFEERACSAIFEHYFFAIARANLVAEGMVATQIEAIKRQRRVEHELRPQLKKLAEKLLRVTDVKTLRAPNKLTPTKRTRSLLNEDLAAA